MGDGRQGGLRADRAHPGAHREPDPARGPQRGRGRPGRGLPRREPERGRGRPQAREGGTLPEQGRNARRGEGEPGARAWRAGSRAGGGTAVNGTGATLLRAECLTKSYAGRRVVCDVSIEVHAGEVVGLLGPNGAGKTTTFYMIVGLTRPDAGTVFLNGEDVTALPMYERARRGVSYLPQEPSVFRKLTVEENIRAILETLDLSPDERAERCRRLLDELGIARLARNKAYSLSGGERRRVEITRALVISPSFMLLDEPFAGIDPIAVVDIQNIVTQLKERGIGVLITDHNVRETLGICDRAYILNEGTVLEEGVPARIAESPRAREIYLGEKFRL
ncbi:MAG: LPS export ABC transporter ATP-binding protein [Deltaproteobacteria bacterium]|nr:MAG: LPS export ABC transporter ATP-binding protein [Deltaproteobacteria bacterium]